jgi:ATP-dependent RNA helicase RhlE
VAISLCDADEAAFLRDIERLIRAAIPATDRRTFSPRPAADPAQFEGARNRSQPNRRGGHRPGNGPAQKQPHSPRQRQPERQPQPQRHSPPERHSSPERHPDDLTGVEFLNRAAKARRDDGRRPQR